MADTLEKRVQDLEYLLAHLPNDLDARFAGADAKAGARFDQLNIRLQALELRVRQVDQAVATNGGKLDALSTQLTQRIDGLNAQMAEVLQRLGPRT